MMLDRDRTLRGRAAAAANLNKKEREYWLKQLSGTLPHSCFPFDYKNTKPDIQRQKITGDFSPVVSEKLMGIKNRSDYILHLYLTAILTLLLHKYTRSQQINEVIIGTPIYKQEKDREFINTVLPLRNRLEPEMTFKDLLFQVKQTLTEAIENQNYPVTLLAEQGKISGAKTGTPLYHVTICLENIHDPKYLQQTTAAMQFFFRRQETAMEIWIEYDGNRYEPATVKRIMDHFFHLSAQVLADVDQPLNRYGSLPPQEKHLLLEKFNKTQTDYPADIPIHLLFQKQAEQTPDRNALISNEKFLTYRELNRRANRLAWHLKSKGAAPNGNMIGIMTESSPNMIVGLLAILKTGSGYLPIDPGTPQNRIKTMLEDTRITLLISESNCLQSHDFTIVQGLRKGRITPIITRERTQIKELNHLPVPNRSLVDYEKYNQYIGLAAVKDSITMQATRGCPYKCAYCHKIWPKTHMIRSAEHIFAEVQGLYNLGIRRFSLIDDIFNLNVKNSSRFFQLIIDNHMELQLFFPNGMRGDLLTKEYIDLMVKAGTINISLSLETASPRLQKMIGKNLKIEKLFDNLKYICEKYPQVILDVQTMHGFPTETEEEARQTLDFIKALKWLHFPYVHVLKIYPNTDMEKLAIRQGIPAEVIERSADQAYHELSETIPFDKHFTLSYQSEFLNDYFLNKERLLHVLPYQLKVLTEAEIVQKYNAYLAEDIRSLDDLLKLTGITRQELGVHELLPDDHMLVPNLNRKLKNLYPTHMPSSNALRVLLLDLSTFFSHHVDVFYDMIEPPLGPMYLLTYLNHQLGDRVRGKILKSRLDFDNYTQLKEQLEEFKPHVIGVRSLTYYKDFFHHTLAVIRNWGYGGPIIAGGPYATSDCLTVLQDRNIDVVVRGEGEVTFCQLIKHIIQNNGKLPEETVLKDIPGIAYIPAPPLPLNPKITAAREILLLDHINKTIAKQPADNPESTGHSAQNFAYNIYTSGSTGTPKGALITHANVTRVVKNTNYIQITPDDRVLQLSNYAFDGSVFDIYGALLNGAGLVLVNKEHLLEVEQLMASIEKWAIDVFFVTTALFNTMVDVGLPRLHRVRKILFGGERVSPEHTQKALQHLGKDRILHMYGPTETTVYATYYPVDEVNRRLGTVPIGTPLANTTVFILDENLEPVPIGVEGEIFIGGSGVAAGYQNHVELTAEKFHFLDIGGSFRENRPLNPLNPLNPRKSFSKQSTVLYRTGDLGRLLWNGQIEFLERKDKQVKLRGFRIELGEIEIHLLNHPQIRETYVTVRKDQHGDEYLCAYYVGQIPVETNSLKEYLSRELPDFMIPAHFIFLTHIPLTTNGKIDKAALPLPKQQKESQGNYTAGLVEKQLAKLWAKILGVNENTLDRDDDFFELGGHSLKATVLLSLIHKELKVKIPVREVFKTPTIRGLAQFIRNASQEAYQTINPVEKKEFYPLSPAQKRLYIIQQMDEHSVGYNMPTTFILEGEIREEKLVQAFETLVQRQESFRTSFITVNEEPVQKIHDKVSIQVNLWEKSSPPLEDTIKKFIHPFDLSQAPLLRVGMMKQSENRYILFTDMHHIISDGTSIGILVKEFSKLYNKKTLPHYPIYYKDFSQWHQTLYGPGLETKKNQEAYWLEEFSGEVPVLELPYDTPRPPKQNFKGKVISFEIDPEKTQHLNHLAAAHDCTLFMILLAAANVLLSKLSGQETIVIGTPVANRTHQDLRQIIGMFVNTLPMKNYPNSRKSYPEFLKEVKNRTLNALENQDYPLENLVEKILKERDASRNPLFDVMFALHNVEIPPVALEEISLKPYPYRHTTSKFDLNWEGVETNDKIIFTLEYSTSLFKEPTIKRYIRYFLNTISNILENPDIKIRELDIMDQAEKKQILEMCEGKNTQIETEETIPRWYETTVNKNAHKAAVIYRHHTLTHHQLNRRANQLAVGLKEKGAAPDQVVGLMVPRSPEMIISILAILKSGAAYLPIDPSYPTQRKQYILKDSRVRLLLTGTKKEEALSNIPDTIESINTHDHRLFRGDGKNLPNPNTGKDLVYVIYTSGSTGKPKGVILEHFNLINLLHFQFNHTSIDCSRMLQFATIGFDASTHEIFSALLQGGRLVLINEEDRTDIPALFTTIEKNDVKTVFFPISFIKTIFSEESYATAFPNSVKHIQSAGEQVVITKRFRQYLQEHGTFLHNHYGPAETHVVTTLTLSPHETLPENPTIGKPLANTRIYILDINRKIQPIGIPGELCIGGNQVGRGYLNNPELTAEKFCRRQPGGSFHENRPLDPRKSFLSDAGDSICAESPVYSTGDLARWHPDGNIEFLGRIDHQVKIRGFRVEPGEIESRLRQFSYIKEAVVIPHRHTNGELYLCAYLEMEKDNIPNELRQQLSQTLPDYMIPAYFVPIEKIPINTHGKIERSALPSPETREIHPHYTPPQNDIQKKLTALWSQVLEKDKEQIGIDNNFFEIGGHSLKGTILTLKIQKIFGIKITLADIFKAQTIRTLAQYLEKMTRTGYSSLIPVEEKEYYPLSPAQRRLYFLHQVDTQNVTYNLGHLFILQGELDEQHLQQVFQQLINRHEALRTWFPLKGDQPIQRIHPRIKFDLQRYTGDQNHPKPIIKEFIHPFNLTRAPLLRVGLVRLSQHRHLFMFDMHHIISDGISMQLIAQDFLNLYANRQLPPLKIQYKDFSHWQEQRLQSPEIQQMETFWLKTFAQPVPPLNLPMDFPRPLQPEIAGSQVTVRLSPPITAALKQLAEEEKTTLFMVTLSIFNILLAKICNQETITVGTAVAGRPHDDIQQIVGVFVNTIALRNYPKSDKRYNQFLQELKENTIQAFENQDYQFETLVAKVNRIQNIQLNKETKQNNNRGTQKNPLFDVAFGFQDIYIPSIRIPGLTLEPYPHESGISKFDLTLYGNDSGEHLNFIFEYRTSLFKHETIRRIAGYLQEITAAITENREIHLREITLSHDYVDMELKVPGLEDEEFDF